MRTKALLCAFLAAAALASARARAVELVRNPDVFVHAGQNDPQTLDPAVAYDNAGAGLLLNVYDSLLTFEGEDNERLAPAVATTVPSRKNGLISQDGLTYKFPIRKNVKFHDGTWLTLPDVRYSILRFMLTDAAGGPSALLLEPILGVGGTRDASGKLQVQWQDADRAVRIEGDKLVIRLKRPFAPFLSIAARWTPIVCRSWAAAHGDWDGEQASWQRYNNPDKQASYFYEHANGTGPFELERWDRQARRVHLKRSDNYWGKPAKLKRVVYMAVPEFATRKLLLQAGDADLIEPTRSFLSQLQNLSGVKIVDGLPRLTTVGAFFTFNINPQGNRDIGSGKLDGEGVPPDFFNDPDVRKGFACAFDYDAALKDLFKGSAKRARGPIPPGMLGYNSGSPIYEFDLKKAANHFKRARGGKVWESGFLVTLTHNASGEGAKSMCQILKKGIESINPKFKVDVRGIEWSSYLDAARNRKLPVFVRDWYGDYADPHNFAFAFYASAGRYPAQQDFHDAELDRLVEAGVRELDLHKRQTIYNDLQKRGFEAAPHILIAYPSGVFAMRTWVQGFRDNPVYLGVNYYPLSK